VNLTAQNYRKISNEFNPNKAATYALNLLIDDFQIAYAVFDTLNDKLILLQDFPIRKDFSALSFSSQLFGILNHSEIKGLSFAGVQVIFANANYTLIPEDVYEPERNDFYIQKIFGAEKLINSEITTHLLLGKQRLVHTFSKEILNVLKSFFGAVFSVHHTMALLLKDLQPYLPHKGNFATFLFVNTYQCDVLIFKGRDLQLINSFSFENDQDFLYYVLFMIEQTDADLRSVPVYMMGAVDKDSALYEELYKYILHLQILMPISEKATEQLIDKADRLKYFKLLSRNFENN